MIRKLAARTRQDPSTISLVAVVTVHLVLIPDKRAHWYRRTRVVVSKSGDFLPAGSAKREERKQFVARDPWERLANHAKPESKPADRVGERLAHPRFHLKGAIRGGCVGLAEDSED